VLETYGCVPNLLVPLAVGVAGRPATIGVTTGVATPINSLIVLAPLFATYVSPEQSIATEVGRFNPLSV
jgi:hypothetical protein